MPARLPPENEKCFVCDDYKTYTQYQQCADGFAPALAQEVDTRGRKRVDFARDMDIDPGKLSRILSGTKADTELSFLLRCRQVLKLPDTANPYIGSAMPFVLDWHYASWLNTQEDFKKQAAVQVHSEPRELFRLAQFDKARRIQAYLWKNVPDGDKSPHVLHPGHELVYIASGQVAVDFWGANKPVTAEKGSALFFDSGYPHRIRGLSRSTDAILILGNPFGCSSEILVRRFDTPESAEPAPHKKSTAHDFPSAEQLERTLSIRAQVALAASPNADQLCTLAHISHESRMGSKPFPLKAAKALASLLGIDLRTLLEPLTIDTLVRRTNLLQPPTDGRVKRTSHRNAQDAGHFGNKPLFAEEDLHTTGPRLFPHLFRVPDPDNKDERGNQRAHPNNPPERPFVERHEPADEAIELFYVLQGTLFVTIEVPGTVARRQFKLTGGDCILFDSGLAHGYSWAAKQPATALHVLYSLSGASGSYML